MLSVKRKAPMQFFHLIFLLSFTWFVAATETNLIDGECADGELGIDYFPDKIDVKYSSLFSVEYFNTYKIVNNLKAKTKYVLYQCGTAAPDDIGQDMTISVPITRVAVGNSYGDVTHLTRIEQLGERLSVKAYTGKTDSITSTCVNDLLDSGDIIEAYLMSGDNCDNEVDLEQLSIAGVDVTFTDNSAYTCEFDNSSELIANAVVASDGHETVYLARLEWIKYFSLFYNLEAEANSLFNFVDFFFECLSSKDKVQVAWSQMYSSELGWSYDFPSAQQDSYIDITGGETIKCGEASVENGGYMSDAEFIECNKDAEVCIFQHDFTHLYRNVTLRASLEELNCVKNERVYEIEPESNWNRDLVVRDLISALHYGDYHFSIGQDSRSWLTNVFTGDLPKSEDDICQDSSLSTEILAIGNDCVDLNLLASSSRSTSVTILALFSVLATVMSAFFF